MRRFFHFIAGVLTIFVSVAAMTLPAATQPLGGEVMQPPLPVHPMKQLWRDIDQLNFDIDQITVYDRYCKPPGDPQIADTQYEITMAAIKYRSLQRQFDRMHDAFDKAIKTRLGLSYRTSFPPLDGVPASSRNYWAKIAVMLKRAEGRIDKLQKKLDGKKEVDCSKHHHVTPPPPPPPPVDWMQSLERPVAAPISLPELPPHFCSELEKTRWMLAHVHPLRIQAAENARFASYYVVDVGRRMREIEGKGINRALTPDEQRGLKELRAEYDWAQRNLAEQDRVAAEVEALYVKAQKIPVIACEERQQIRDLSQPSYEPTGPAELPDRFCSEAQKAAFLREVAEKKAAAERNYDKANAKVAEFADRIGKGDKSKATSDAFQEASKAAGSYFQLILSLDAVLDQARAMPVVDCAKADQRAERTQSGPHGPHVPDDGKEPPPLNLPSPDQGNGEKPEKPAGSYMYPWEHKPVIASLPRSSDGALTADVGYTEVDTPRQVFGRIVFGGKDFALALSPEALKGFRGEAEYEKPVLTGNRWTSLAFGLSFTDVSGDQDRHVVNDGSTSSGFVWIDPLDPGTPVAVGLAGTGLTWDTHVSSNITAFSAKAIYQSYYPLSPHLTASYGVGLTAGYQDTEHRSTLINLDYAGFNVYENYDFTTWSVGPRLEGALNWECDPDKIFKGSRFTAQLSAFVAPSYDFRDFKARQRAMSPVPFTFDYMQRMDLNDDGFNLRYGVEGTAGFTFDQGTSVFVKAGWLGESDAPTIHPADGSFAPGAPIKSDTRSADQWYVGGGVRFEF
ncbi:MAG: hypothetical protein GC190_04525 [Alphaproteobacteria bacterium]|nr:hypothetical protein [Alphaproteobacteria bacterium]